MFRRFNLYEQTETKINNLANSKLYLFYDGDRGYPMKLLLLRPSSRRNLTPQQEEFDKSITVVEWGFSKVDSELALLDNKIMLQDVQSLYKIAVFF